MVIEFLRNGKTYKGVHDAAPATPTIQVVFKPCALKPPFLLELTYLGYDEIRMIHLYKPIREVQ